MSALLVGAIFNNPAPALDPAHPAQAYLSGPLFWWLCAGFLVSVVLLLIQHGYEVQRRTYDPTWIFRFVDQFESDDFIELRGTAATLLKNNPGKLKEENLKALTDVDPVLDFFDSVGFYQHGNQISPEVVHQEFEYWIRGYYQATRDYIATRQRKEPTVWEYVPQLFETVESVEAYRAGPKFIPSLSVEELTDFLEEEIETWEAVKRKAGRSERT